MSKPLVVALVGFGNIGSGVVAHVQAHGPMIDARLRRPLRLKTICDRDLTMDRGVSIDAYHKTTDFREVLADPEVDAVIELVGGTRVAREVVMGALGAGKHVVTANKALVATFGGELFREARKTGAHLLFEAAVMAGVPVIRSLHQGLAPARFTSLAGILNGTCNYILTELAHTPDASYTQVLADAQRLGYAEPDPTLDVEGNDAAHKVAILGSLLFGKDLRADNVATRGVSGLDGRDIAFAHAHGFALKLLATAALGADGEPSLAVWPTLVPRDHLVARVEGVLNALWVDAEPIGPTLQVGAGAGKGSTSTGILADLANLANLGDQPDAALNPLCAAFLGERVEPGPASHPERLARLIAPGAGDRLRAAGLRVVQEDASHAFAVAPPQDAAARQAMLAKLGLGNPGEGGISMAGFEELRWGLLPAGHTTPF